MISMPMAGMIIMPMVIMAVLLVVVMIIMPMVIMAVLLVVVMIIMPMVIMIFMVIMVVMSVSIEGATLPEIEFDQPMGVHQRH